MVLQTAAPPTENNKSGRLPNLSTIEDENKAAIICTAAKMKLLSAPPSSLPTLSKINCAYDMTALQNKSCVTIKAF